MIGWLLGTVTDLHTYVGVAVGAALGWGTLKLYAGKAVTAVEAQAKKL